MASEWEARSACGRFGQLEPSMAAKMGSLPFVSSHRRAMLAAVTLMASAGW
ncbi:hypothetical protein D3C83_192570 [compost metagenome]